MRRNSSLTAMIVLIAMIVTQEFEPLAWAQTPPPSPQQLDQLLAPVALYPDSLLAQITTASTNPQEILDVDNWLQQNPGLTGTALTDAAEKQGFDPAFIALTNFPQVLNMMALHVDDYAAIGEAFLADQGSVTASIQRLRAQAYAAGSLQSNAQQQVEVQQASGQTIYVIQPASPQVVYVPVYNPTVVYAAPSTGTVVAASLITFGAGIAIGALLVNNQPWGWGGWGWNWGGRRVYYNHVTWVRWGNPYRPPHVWYRPRPVPYSSRPGYGGNWHYRPPNYRPPVPGYRPPNHKPWGPNNRPGVRPPVNRPPNQQPSPGRPTQPIAKPGTQKPPSSTRPPAQSKPNQPQPNRPPANHTKPPATTRPTPQPKPAPPAHTKPQATTRPAPQPTPAPAKPRPNPPPPNHSGDSRPAPQPKPANPSGARPQNKPPSQPRPAPKAQPNQQPRDKPQ